jgi:hypothetical protein
VTFENYLVGQSLKSARLEEEEEDVVVEEERIYLSRAALIRIARPPRMFTGNDSSFLMNNYSLY